MLQLSLWEVWWIFDNLVVFVTLTLLTHQALTVSKTSMKTKAIFWFGLFNDDTSTSGILAALQRWGYVSISYHPRWINFQVIRSKWQIFKTISGVTPILTVTRVSTQTYWVIMLHVTVLALMMFSMKVKINIAYIQYHPNTMLQPPSKFGGLAESSDWVTILTRMMETDGPSDRQIQVMTIFQLKRLRLKVNSKWSNVKCSRNTFLSKIHLVF